MRRIVTAKILRLVLGQHAGAPTDFTVSTDGAHIATFSVDEYGGLFWAATTVAIGVLSFNGVAFSHSSDPTGAQRPGQSWSCVIAPVC
jgi:hypothetical protein